MGFILLILFLELLGGGFSLGSSLAENSQNPIAELSRYALYAMHYTFFWSFL